MYASLLYPTLTRLTIAQAFSLANGTQEPAYQIIGKDMTRANRFAGAMQAYTSGPDFDVSHVLDNYD